ncbi:hypothetical protein LNP00_00145 [Fructobacillus sp. M158]|uniref:hypothetical protein n=1 Tax=Fructobacillus parabroussonetiae TaxID=2713174 RepID=UPI00200B4A14|nr:hypothetical protein [Fructobacillus parabroussonetiae]MCK8616780.1 hypothetical protein [Fructobacillus parabroussonetiae]
MSEQAHIFIESALLPHKNKTGLLDQIEGELTKVGLAATFKKSKPHHSLYQKARLVARDKAFADRMDPIVVIGNEAAANEVLSGFLSIDPDKKRPLLLCQLSEKNVKVADLVNQLTAALKVEAIVEEPMAMIEGDVPNKGRRYFLHYLQVGPDFSALLPTFNQKVVWKQAWQQFLDFWNLISRNQDKVTFAWSLRQGSSYQLYAKTLGLQVLNQADQDQPFNLRVVNQVAWPKILLTYLQGKKGRENPSRRGFITQPLKNEAAIHIRDLQGVKLDGNALENGAYSFQVKEAGTYPVISFSKSKETSK